MTREQFMEAIVKYLRNGSIQDTIKFLEHVPGRNPRKSDLELSRWYIELSKSDKLYAQRMLKEGIDSALFGLFCVLDGSRTVLDDEGEFDLTFNGAPLIEDNYDFHELYNAITFEVDKAVEQGE